MAEDIAVIVLLLMEVQVLSQGLQHTFALLLQSPMGWMSAYSRNRKWSFAELPEERKRVSNFINITLTQKLLAVASWVSGNHRKPVQLWFWLKGLAS